MKNKTPLVSVVMPVYNGEKFVTLAVESVLWQSWGDFELVIIDDCSTDTTYRKLEAWANGKQQVRLERNTRRLGVGESTNRAIRISRGRFIARMDADDVMQPTRLARQVELMQANPALVACGTWMREINETGEVVGWRRLPTSHEKIYAMVAYVMGIQHPTLMVDRDKLPKDFSWYNRSELAEDLDLLFRLLRYGEFGNVGEYLVDYRIHGDNMSLGNWRRTFEGAMRVRERAMREYGYRLPMMSRVLFELSKLVRWLPDRLVWWLYRRMRR